MKEVKCELVDMYTVKPNWGNKNLRVVKRRVIKRGKSLFQKMSKAKRWHSVEQLFATPKEAIQDRLRDVQECIKEEKKYDTDRNAEVKAIKDLLKSVS